MGQDWDIIVIGGGHAGCEAASAAARMGCRVALLTLNPSRIGFMSCNPAIGGLAKGQLVKEIDALGGLMGRITDLSAIQYRRLNASKGPAVRSSRAQCDKAVYSRRMGEAIAATPGLTILSGEADRIEVEGGKVVGLRLSDGTRLATRAVIITSGTFLGAVMHTGEARESGGRVGDRASFGLTSSLAELGFPLRRLKTGTPPRLHRRSIDFAALEPQPGDANPRPFSFYARPETFPVMPQIECFITYTNAETHAVIEENLHLSPMRTGAITGAGPRYCPSIEDKVVRFRDKERHQIFLEPEGIDVDEIYVNGVSTSLPREVQERFIRSIRGLEKAEFLRHGYAVEYDAVDSRVLKLTLESKDVAGLFLAGQVNGTSGYEEAGGQGLIAGIGAALSVRGEDPFVLRRDEAYIGVLIDDLTLTGSDEPYRMFTSRAEYRLLLREDNADLRLSEHARQLGLLTSEEYSRYQGRVQELARGRQALETHYFLPTAAMNSQFAASGIEPIADRVSASGLLRRPEVDWDGLCGLGFPGVAYSPECAEQLEIQTKYEGYIRRDLELLEGVRKSDRVMIPRGLDFERVPGLSNEVKGRLKLVRPETLGQAARTPGVTPAAVANLLIYLRTHA